MIWKYNIIPPDKLMLCLVLRTYEGNKFHVSLFSAFKGSYFFSILALFSSKRYLSAGVFPAAAPVAAETSGLPEPDLRAGQDHVVQPPPPEGLPLQAHGVPQQVSGKVRSRRRTRRRIAVHGESSLNLALIFSIPLFPRQRRI